MAVYVVAQLNFINEHRYRRYQAQFAEVFSRSSGRLLCAEESPELLEGDWMGNKVVLMEFPTKEDALRMLNDPEYQRISEDRKAGAQTVSLLVRGLE